MRFLVAESVRNGSFGRRIGLSRSFLLGSLVFPQPTSDRNVSESTTVRPVSLTALAEISRLREAIIVVVTEFGVERVATRAFEQLSRVGFGATFRYRMGTCKPLSNHRDDAAPKGRKTGSEATKSWKNWRKCVFGEAIQELKLTMQDMEGGAAADLIREEESTKAAMEALKKMMMMKKQQP